MLSGIFTLLKWEYIELVLIPNPIKSKRQQAYEPEDKGSNPNPTETDDRSKKTKLISEKHTFRDV